MGKKFLSVLAAALCVVGFAACEKKIDLSGNEVTTLLPPVLRAEDVTSALAGIAGENADIDQLTPEQRQQLQRALADQGHNVTVDQAGVQVLPPEGVTIPSTVPKTTRIATTLPDGVSVDAAQVKKYMQKTIDITKSGTFTMKASTASPYAGGAMTSMTMVTKGDQFAVEFPLDWMEIADGLSEGDDKFGQAKIQAALMQTATGSKTRMVFLPGKMYWVFPDRKTYVDFADAMDEGAKEISSFGDIFANLPSGTEELKASKVTLGKEEFLCAQTATNDGTSTKFYFNKKGDLKRIELIGTADETADNAIIEIDELKASADSSYFSVKGFVKMPLAEMTKLFSSFS
jgi:hypothetical protein